MFTPLSFPVAPLKLTRKKNLVYVKCLVRKKELLVTPEEWVRQHLLHYLINEKQIPIGLISSEMAIEVNQLSRRCDVVVFGKDGNPRMIIECKAPEVKLTEKVFRQIAQYNFTLNVDFLILTNGLENIACKIDRSNSSLIFLENLPNWEELNPV
jgi:hypothetical protein